MSHTSQQNGVVEWKNITLVECVQNIIKGKNITNGFWAESINTAFYLKNRSPTKSFNHKTHFEALYGYKPVELKHLRVFGSKSFSHVPKENRRALNAKAIKWIFIGYSYDHKAYNMIDPGTHKVFVSIDVLFHEHANEEHKVDNYDAWHIPCNYDENVKELADVEQEQEHDEDSNSMDTSSSQGMPRGGGDTPQSRRTGESSEAPRRSTWQTQPTIRYKYYAIMTQIMEVKKPATFDHDKNHKVWMDAMREEHDAIMRNETWELT